MPSAVKISHLVNSYQEREYASWTGRIIGHIFHIFSTMPLAEPLRWVLDGESYREMIVWYCKICSINTTLLPVIQRQPAGILQILKPMFPERFISLRDDIDCPPRSCDLMPLYLWRRKSSRQTIIIFHVQFRGLIKIFITICRPSFIYYLFFFFFF